MPLALGTSMYCEPMTRSVVWPFRELIAMVGELAGVGWVALFPRPD